MWGWSAGSTGEQPTGLLSAPTAAEQSDMASDDITAALLLLFRALVEMTHERARMNQSTAFDSVS